MAAQGQLVRGLLGGGAAYFRAPVRWLLGRDLLAQASSILLYSAFGTELDHRDWMYPEVEDLSDDPDAAAAQEFWFDYLADAGDGQLAMYSVAYLALGDAWLSDKLARSGARVFTTADAAGANAMRLPRGRFLFVGGDTSYHVSDPATMLERFTGPFNWAYSDKRETAPGGELAGPERLLFAIPGNHDYYDSLSGFNRQFRTAPDTRDRPLPIADFVRKQQASFTAIKLPFDWLLCGLDSQAGKLSFRQTRFFQELLAPAGCPRRLILATPEPTTLFGTVDHDATKPFADLKLPRPFFAPKPGDAQVPGQVPGDRIPADCVHLDLAGDIHHYARYFGPGDGQSNYASVVAGGGGAFMHPTQTDVERHRVERDPNHQPLPKVQYPLPGDSRRAVSPLLLLPWRIADGGFVWLIGALLSVITAFAFLVAPSTRFLQAPIARLAGLIGWLGGHTTKDPVPGPTHFASDGLTYIVEHVLSPTDPRALTNPCLPDGIELVFIGLVAALLAVFAIGTARLMRKARAPHTVVPNQAYLKRLLLLVAAVGVMVLGYRVKAPPEPENIYPLRASVLVMLYLSVLPAAIVWSLRYVASLARQARRRPVTGVDYVPVWTALTLGAVAAGFGVFRHGGHAVGVLVSDMMAVVVVVGVIAGMPLAGAFAGAVRLRARSKLAVAALGLWMGLLILIVPLLLAAYGGVMNVLAIAGLVAVANGIGWKWLSRGERAWPLLVAWLLLGTAVIVAAAWAPEARPPSWWRLLFAGAAGAALSCLWFGWYLATSLALDAHNNEAGGAARVESYKHILRVRLRRDELTVFVLGIPEPCLHGRDLKPVLVDTFTLRPS